MSDEPEPLELPPEIALLIDQRQWLFEHEGFPPDEARELAALLFIDPHDAAALHEGGCDFYTLLRILT